MMNTLIYILLLLPTLLLANSGDVIDWSNFDNDKYNSILVNEIRSIRHDDLEVDSVMCNAANMHGLYLCENSVDFHVLNKNGHKEIDSPLSMGLSDRIRFFNMNELNFNPNKGGGEVCAMFYGYKFTTYSELVSKVLSTYKSSKDHWEIITSGGNAAGGSIHLSEGGNVYSVIVFYDKKEINRDVHNNIVKIIMNGTMDSLYANYKNNRVVEYDSILGEYEDYSRVSEEAQKYIELFSSWEFAYPDKSIKEKYILLTIEYKKRIIKYDEIKKAF